MIIERITLLLCGKMRAGKDESCKIILSSLPNCYEFFQLALASKVKDYASQVFNVPREAFDNPDTKHLHREKAIITGKLGRLINEDTWVDKINYDVKTKNSIITDVRFTNEVDRLKQLESERHKIITVKLQADENVRISRGAQPEFFDDPSEVGLDSIPNSFYDYVVENNTSDGEKLKTDLTPIINQIKSYFVYKEPDSDILDILNNPAAL